MNLQHLKYMIEVEKTGSVTKAAANLFMAQPNLSKAIKEVENEIGITVFRRSAKGVYPTPEGAEFLRNARLVTEQFGKLEAAYKTEKTKKVIAFDVPFGYSAVKLISGLADELDPADEYELRCFSCNMSDALERLSSGESDFSVIRCTEDGESFFKNMIDEKRLSCELLCMGEYKLTFCADSLLGKLSEYSKEALSAYTQIINCCETEISSKRIYIDSAEQAAEYLSSVNGSYMLCPQYDNGYPERYGLKQTAEFTIRFSEYLVYHKDCSEQLTETVRKLLCGKDKTDG